MIGNRFERLLVVSHNGKTQWGSNLWNCLCDCGKEVVVTTSNLNSGNTRSCGCLHREIIPFVRKTHGKRYSREYKAWTDMKTRCTNPKSKSFSDYGGRNIEVCNGWLESFEKFYEDMGNCPSGFTLERKDVNLGYTPSNCEWRDRSFQAYNRRRLPSNTSGKTGVKLSSTGNRWVATISVNNKQISLGSFIKFEDAVLARKDAEMKYRGKMLGH